MLPEYTLQISGEVKLFVTIEPRAVYLQGKPGETLSAAVNIVREKAYPFKIKKVKTLNRIPLEHSVEAWEEKGRTGFRIQLSFRQKDPGRYRDALLLETDSDIQPLIRINVSANVESDKPRPAAAQDNQDFNALIRQLQKQQNSTPAGTEENPARKKSPEEIKKLFQELIKKQQQTE